MAFLLGAGTSKEAGGPLLGNIPKEIEEKLMKLGVEGSKAKGWLKLFYEAVRRVSVGQITSPIDDTWVVNRLKNLKEEQVLKANYESVLSCLVRWRSVMEAGAETMRLEKPPGLEIEVKELDETLRNAKSELIARCQLPANKSAPDALKTHKEFLKKILTRPLNLKRVNVFSLNYDTLVEQAADAEGIVLVDGFVGTICRAFRPESFDQDLYFPAETTEGRVHRLERVVHLYKLHGSVNWCIEEPSWNNPYGVVASQARSTEIGSVLVYPTPTKFGDVLGMPYAELHRRFASSVVRRQSTLFAIGYGFGDDHVNAIIRQALAIPSFSLVVIDPFCPSASSKDSFVGVLRAQKDRRVWTISGESLGTFSRFVESLLPDLRDEEILGKVMKTYRALGGEEHVGAREESNAE